MSEPEQLYIPDLERALNDIDEFNTFTRGLRNESPRAVVLITLCVLDSLLNKLLRLRLDTSDMNTAQENALKNFTSKVSLAQGLGLIGKIEVESLIALNTVRNKFAHSWDASFEMNEVSKACRKLPVCFTDVQEQSPDQLNYDHFRYTVGHLLRGIINRCSLLKDTHQVSGFWVGVSCNRNYVREW